MSKKASPAQLAARANFKKMVQNKKTKIGKQNGKKTKTRKW